MRDRVPDDATKWADYQYWRRAAALPPRQYGRGSAWRHAARQATRYHVQGRLWRRAPRPLAPTRWQRLGVHMHATWDAIPANVYWVSGGVVGVGLLVWGVVVLWPHLPSLPVPAPSQPPAGLGPNDVLGPVAGVIKTLGKVATIGGFLVGVIAISLGHLEMGMHILLTSGLMFGALSVLHALMGNL